MTDSSKLSRKNLFIKVLAGIFLVLLSAMIITTVQSCRQSYELKKHYEQLVEAIKNNNYSQAKTEFRYFREQKKNKYRDVHLLKQKFVIDELKREYDTLPDEDLDKRLRVCRTLARLDPAEEIHEKRIRELEYKIRIRDEEIAARKRYNDRVTDLKREAVLQKTIETSGRYITQSNYLGALSRSLLERATQFQAQGDQAALNKFLRDNHPSIFVLKGGDEVLFEDSAGMFSGLVKVRPVGSTVSFWTSFNALKAK